jgi:Spy/CpxP family protein refolding chaperone
MKLRMAMLSGALALVMAGAALAQGGGGRPGGGFGRGPGGGGAGSLLMMEEVRKELKIDEAQQDLLMQLGQEMRTKAGETFRNLQDVPREERDKRFAAFNAEYQKKIGEILDAKQMARLRQLEIQRGGVRSLTRKDVQDELKLTADQRTRIEQAMDGERQAMQQAFEGFRNGGQMTDEQRQAARTKFEEARKGTETKLLGVLTEPQKKQFTAMQGPLFKFPEVRFGPGGPGGRPQRPNNNT